MMVSFSHPYTLTIVGRIVEARDNPFTTFPLLHPISNEKNEERGIFKNEL